MKNKKLLSIFLIFCMMLALSGCFNRIPGKIWKNPNLEDIYLFVDVMLGDTLIEEVQENNVITRVSWQKLKLSEKDSKTYPELSKTFDKYNEESLTEAKALMYEFIPYAKEMSGDEYNSAYCEAETKKYVQRADNYIVSFLERGMQYTGGVHPDYFVHGRNYDTKTGEEVKLTDVLKDTKALPEILEKKITEKYSGVTFFDLADTFSKYEAEQFTWTMDYQGITIWFSPYEIAAFSVGTLSARLWFDEFPEMFNEKYLVIPPNYTVSLPVGQDIEFDLVSDDGVRDSVYTEERPDKYGSYNMLSVVVNGKTYTDEINYGYDFKVYLVHINDKNYIYSQTTSDGDYNMFQVVDINDGKMAQIEQLSNTGFYNEYIEEGFENGTVYTLVFNNTDYLKLNTKFDILGTHGAVAEYRVDEKSGKPVMTDEAYTFTYGHDVKSAIPLEAELLPKMEKREIPSGTMLTPYQTDGKTFVDLKTEDEKIIRLKVDTSGWPRLVNGIPEEECFEELLYAG